jgi:hypothetical protein
MIERLLHRPGPWRKQRAELAVRIARLRHRILPRPCRDELEAMTGRDAIWWTLFVQAVIADAFRDNPKDPDHPVCDPAEWLNEVLQELADRRPKAYGDENMWLARALSLVLATWDARISRAKAFDPRRPVALRRQAYNSYLRFGHALAAVTLDERGDFEMFDQPWESPYDPEATDGSFI